MDNGFQYALSHEEYESSVYMSDIYRCGMPLAVSDMQALYLGNDEALQFWLNIPDFQRHGDKGRVRTSDNKYKPADIEQPNIKILDG